MQFYFLTRFQVSGECASISSMQDISLGRQVLSRLQERERAKNKTKITKSDKPITVNHGEGIL